MKKSLFICLICLLWCKEFNLYGQSMSFRTVSVEDGLSNNFVRKIYKDSHGFIWVGTLNGLDRFDGISFKPYIKPNEQKGETYDILETDPDHLWVATSTGLWKLNYDNEQLVKIDIPENSPVYTLCYDDNGNILAGTSSGLFIISDNLATHIPLVYESEQYNVIIYGISQNNESSCWLATSSGLFYCDYSAEKANIIRYHSNLANAFTSIQKTGPKIYMGTHGAGVVEFDILTKQFSEYIHTGNKNILFLTGDQKDHLWVGTDGGGLTKISISQNTIVASYVHESQDPYSIRSNAVYSFLEDAENDILWVGSYSTGLSYTINKRFNTYVYNGFTTRNHHIRSFLIKDNERLIGTRDGFIYINEQTDAIKKYNTGEENHFLKSNTITKIFPYENKYLLGTLNGVCMFDGKQLSIQEFHNDPLFKSGGFYDFTIDDNGNIWMATFKGVIKVSPNKEFRQYHTKNSSLISNLVHSIHKDSSGKIWVGTKNGVCYFDHASDSFKKTDILPSSVYSCKITYIYEDRNANIWFCTETDGLYQVNSQLTQYEHYTTNDLLPDNAVTSIMQDDLGYFWVATHKGLARCTFTDNKYVLYWISDGLPGLMFNPGACFYERKNGRLWWGNENGLIYSNIDHINKKTTPSPTEIIHFYINGKEISGMIPPLNKAINRTSDIRLTRFENSFGFDFVALNYLYPNDNIFETKLDGIDESWQLLDKGKTSVYYGDISPGKYIFRVRLSGYPGTEKSITVRIKHSLAGLIWLIPTLLLCCLLVFFVWRSKKAAHKQKIVNKKKPSKNETVNKDYGIQYEALLHLMDEKKPYLDPELKMSYLTVELKCSTKELSDIFKESVQQSFPDFINGYRINEFKEKIKNREHEKYTILALSEQCGFSSRSSFFRVFKKLTGVTPLEYLKQIKYDNEPHKK